MVTILDISRYFLDLHLLWLIFTNKQNWGHQGTALGPRCDEAMFGDDLYPQLI